MFSPNGRILASILRGEGIALWDAASGTSLLTLRSDDAPWIHSLTFAPDSRLLAAACEDQTVRLWDVEKGCELHVTRGQHGEVIRAFGHPGEALAVAFSPDGETLASGSWHSLYRADMAEGSDKTVALWDVDGGCERLAFVGHDFAVHSLAFSPDGRILASGGFEDGYLKPRASRGQHEAPVKTGADCTIKLWDAMSGENLHAIAELDPTVAVAFSPDGGLLASGSQFGHVKIWNMARGEKPHVLTGHQDVVASVVFSPDGQTLASGSEDGTIKLWDVPRGRELHTIAAQGKRVRSVSFSPDGLTLDSELMDGTLELWDAVSGRPSAQLRKG